MKRIMHIILAVAFVATLSTIAVPHSYANCGTTVALSNPTAGAGGEVAQSVNLPAGTVITYNVTNIAGGNTTMRYSDFGALEYTIYFNQGTTSTPPQTAVSGNYTAATQVSEVKIVYNAGVTFDGSVSFTCPGDIIAPLSVFDGRINTNYGDSNVGILYEGTNGALDLYRYETDRYIAGFITPEEIEPYQSNPPAQNTLIKSTGIISVYILSNGQIQFNFGPDEEGKTWVFVMDDLADRINEDSYYIPPPG